MFYMFYNRLYLIIYIHICIYNHIYIYISILLAHYRDGPWHKLKYSSLIACIVNPQMIL